MPIDLPPPAVVHRDPQAFADERILAALHQLENPHNRRAPGTLGELGPYQMRQMSWEQVSRAPFTADEAFGPAGHAAAMAYIRFLRMYLESHHVPATPAAIAGAWNAGPGRAVRGQPPSLHRLLRQPIQQPLLPMSHIPLTPVTSSLVKAVGHDPDASLLAVQHHDDSVYHYEGVSKSKYNKLLDADSVGNFLHEQVRGIHSFVKVSKPKNK